MLRPGSKARAAMAPSPTPAHSRRIDKKKFTHVSSKDEAPSKSPCRWAKKKTEQMFERDSTTFSYIHLVFSGKEIARGEHLALCNYKYVDASGSEKVWEVVERRERPKTADVDMACSIPVLRRLLKYDCLVLVKQYRPATKAFTLEFPSGVLENLDSSSQHAALRRLKSQTGYTSTGLKRTSPATASDPIHTSCTARMMSVEVNGDDLRNTNARQDFEEGELYEVVQVPINDVLQRLDEYAKDGYVVDSRVYAFALGLAMGIEIGESNNEKEDSDVQFVTNIIDQ